MNICKNKLTVHISSFFLNRLCKYIIAKSGKVKLKSNVTKIIINTFC